MTDVDEELRAVYAASRARLVRSAYVVTRDLELAEDAVQTAFVKAYASWSRVRRADDHVAYLRRMVINAALAAERKSSRKRELPAAYPIEHDAAADDDVPLLARDAVWRAISGLPPRQRAVVALRYYEDLSEREIAEVLGCRPGTVKSQAWAAMKSLRAVFEEQNERDRA